MIYLGLVCCAAAWGSTFFMIKGALADVHPLALVAHRFFIATLLMGGVVALRKIPFWPGFRESLTLSGWLWLSFATQSMGLEFTTATNSGFITGLFVAFVPLYGWLLRGRRPPSGEWAAVAVSLAGLWVLTGGLSNINRGDLLTLLTALAYAGWIFRADELARQGADPYRLTFHQLIMVTLLSWAAGLILGIEWEIRSTGAWGTIAFLSTFPTVVALVITLIAQRTVDPLRVALIFALEPAFAAAFAWTLGGEPFAARRAWGGGLIVLALVLAERPIKPRELFSPSRH